METTLEPLTEEQFLQLNPKDKRIRLAKDVLYYLTNCKIVARGMTYLDFGKKYHESSQVKFVIQQNETCEPCYVCAVGALFMAEVLYTNKATVREASRGYFIKSRLLPYFSTKQLYLIEYAFEDREYFQDNAGFRERMITIMENIIDNDGEFKPERERILCYLKHYYGSE